MARRKTHHFPEEIRDRQSAGGGVVRVGTRGRRPAHPDAHGGVAMVSAHILCHASAGHSAHLTIGVDGVLRRQIGWGNDSPYATHGLLHVEGRRPRIVRMVILNENICSGYNGYLTVTTDK